MKNNRFVFIIPFRNVKDYIKQCADSLLLQNYQNWIAIFCDDASTDETCKNIPNDDRFIIRRNEERLTALPNIHNAIIESNLNDEDIICILDGDDFLIRRDAVNIIDNLYNDNTLLTYGQYAHSNGIIGHCRSLTEDMFKDIRNIGFWTSHMRTYKYKLYKEIINQDPSLDCFKDKDGNFYKSSCDVATMLPLLEMAGFNRIKFNPEPIYYYRIHENNDHNIDSELQKDVASQIFKKNKFKVCF